MASASGNTAALTAILKSGNVNLNLQTIGGETPLIKAVMFCKPDILAILLKAGANNTM